MMREIKAMVIRNSSNRSHEQQTNDTYQYDTYHILLTKSTTTDVVITVDSIIFCQRNVVVVIEQESIII